MERQLSIGPKTHREDLRIFMGKVVECWSEIVHVTIYYEFNPAKGNIPECTSCGRGGPRLLRYEKDHMGQVFWDALCETCSPKSLLDKLSQG